MPYSNKSNDELLPHVNLKNKCRLLTRRGCFNEDRLLGCFGALNFKFSKVAAMFRREDICVIGQG
jgi:hypothetical protein